MNLPPCLNCERSVFSFSIASLISDSKALKSKGSSEPVGVAVVAEDEEESEREASRAALPPFLYVGVVLLKVRVVGVWCAVVAATRATGLRIAVVSLVREVAMGVWMQKDTESYIVLRWQCPATAGANKVIVSIVLLAFLRWFVESVATLEPRKPNVERYARDVEAEVRPWPGCPRVNP